MTSSASQDRNIHITVTPTPTNMTSNTTFSFTMTAPDATMNLTLTIPTSHPAPAAEDDTHMSDVDSQGMSAITMRPVSANQSTQDSAGNLTNQSSAPFHPADPEASIREDTEMTDAASIPAASYSPIDRSEPNQDVEITDSDSYASSQISSDTQTEEEIDEMYARLQIIERDRSHFINRVWDMNPDLETKVHWSRLVAFSQDAAMWAYDNRSTFLHGWREINERARQIETAQTQIMQAILNSGYDADEEDTNSSGTDYSSSQSDDSMDIDGQDWPEYGGVPLPDSDSDSIITGDIW